MNILVANKHVHYDKRALRRKFWLDESMMHDDAIQPALTLLINQF